MMILELISKSPWNEMIKRMEEYNKIRKAKLNMGNDNKGKKNDFADGKVRMDLLPWPELEEIARVFTAGAKKYGPNNWQNLPDGYQRYKAAMLRHLCELEKGNDVDGDTGCLHAAQIAWNALAMLHFKMQEYKQREDNGIDYLDEPHVSAKGKPQKNAL